MARRVQNNAAEPDSERVVRQMKSRQAKLELRLDELSREHERLQSVLRRYVDLYSFGPIGYFTLDGNGTIRDVNLTGCGLLGQPRSRLLGRRFRSFVTPDTQPDFLELLSILPRSRKKESCEVSLRRDSESSVPVRVQAVASGDEDVFYLAVMDIADRKQAEDALKESEARLELAQRCAGAGVWDWDLATGRLNWSRELFALFGLDPSQDETTFEMWDAVLHPDDKALSYDRIERAIENGTPLSSDYRVVRPDGEIRWISALGRTTCDQSGTPLRMTGICIDITDRKREQEALVQSREQIARVLESISDAFFTLDPDWRFTYVNNEAERILMKSRDQLIGSSIWAEFPEAVGTAFQTNYQRSVTERVDVQFEAYYAPFGVWFEVRAYPHQDGLSVYFRDCTDRRAAQEASALASRRNARIANILQQSLISPQSPIQPKGYEIAARYLPALSEAEVCGDFYDLIDLGASRIGIVIGDVVGKGLGAAARVAAVKYTLRSYAYLNDHPSKVMEITNSALCKDTFAESDMLTAFFAVLDVETGNLTYANAGHEPPCLRHTDRTVELLSEGGPMFTGMDDYAYTERTTSLRDEDVLVLLTDGIAEARRDSLSELFGERELMSCLLKLEGASAEETVNGVLEDAVSFAGGELRDDVAVVVIRKTGGEKEQDGQDLFDLCFRCHPVCWPLQAI